MSIRSLLVAFLLLALTGSANAGLYLSTETTNDLPSHWRGFLLDQRSLRQIAVPAGTVPASPLRLKYLDDLKKLSEKDKLTADEVADQGALLVRLGKIDQAIDVLRGGQAKHPQHFAIAANLGTAWQLKGDLAAAADSLRQAVRFAPAKWLPAEEAHLKLVRGRMSRKQSGQNLDDLFGVRYFTAESEEMPAADRKLLPAKAVALTQQLALWLPADGSLLWQLAELANVHGDVRTAASLMEGCVGQFGMNDRDLRRRRQLAKEAVAKLPPIEPGDKVGHQPGHAGSLAFRSRKPLNLGHIESVLPAIKEAGVNAIPWDALTSTPYEGKFPPKYSQYVKDLGGKTVSLTGFLQPLREDGSAFLFIESPVGCWYCEMPDMAGIVVLEPAAGETIAFQQGLLRVVGRLAVNASDPEEFLFTLRGAKVAPVD